MAVTSQILVGHVFSDAHFDWLRELEEFETLMQSINCVLDLHNGLKFFQCPSWLDEVILTQKKSSIA